MNQRSEHLSDAQIESYWEIISGAGPDTDQVEKHLADCPVCRSRVLQIQRTSMGLLPDSDPERSQFTTSSGNLDIVEPNSLLADQKVKTDNTPDCPSESDIRDLAAGLLPDARATELTQHAAFCNHCGPLLRAYTEDFSDEFSQEEKGAVDQVKSSSPGWQRKTARIMMRAAEVEAGAGTAASPARKLSARPEKKSFFWKWVIPATAAACTLVGVGYWDLYLRETPEKVEKLLAQAYTEQRTMEMRWPGAEWGPPRVTRGSEDSRFSKPDSLQQASEMVDKHQALIPNDIRWLRAKAEIEMLDGDPESAVKTLSPALDAGRDSDLLAMDSAIAFFQRSIHTGSRADLEESIQLLTGLVQRDPTNREALFNLATAYGQRGDWNEAISRWNAYLLLDREGRWAQEAAKQRDIAKSKLH